MAQVLANGMIIKIQIWSHDVEQAAVNTLHYLVTGVGGSPATLEDFCAAFGAAIDPNYAALLNNNAQLDGVVGQIIFPLPLKVGVKDDTHADVGTGGATAGPRQAAGLISWKSALAGPGGRGRTYIPFPAAQAMDTDGTPTATYVTALGVFDVAVGGFTSVSVAGRTATVEIGFRRTKDLVWVPFTDGINNKRWATQKRRGSYGRPNSSPFTP